jgi:hypothetical protein
MLNSNWLAKHPTLVHTTFDRDAATDFVTSGVTFSVVFDAELRVLSQDSPPKAIHKNFF